MVRKNALLLILLLLVLLIRLFSFFPDAVEQWYSTGFYPKLAAVQRVFLGWIPISVGDLLYAWAGIYIIRKTVGLAWKFRRKHITRAYLLATAKKILLIGLVIYCWFNISWGLNYNRVSIGKQLGLVKDSITPSDLRRLTMELADSLNRLAAVSHPNLAQVKSKRILFNGSVNAYQALVRSEPIFQYDYPSVKPSMYSYLGNYMGFTGYYNPFTAEAQVNTTVPYFIRPFTTCHEIGHQLGYAKEYEANLAGFLSASSSNDPVFRYSVYFEMYAYARPYLYITDSIELKRIDSTLHPYVISDFRELRKFIREHQNPVETVIDIVYSQYLRMNEQPSGRLSYNEVIFLLMAYFKKYKWER
ncbi:MAG TPA: DUF3810 domain-containing protein [Flavitalea sp.]|nr:DUF3810 domain-containing protein [Flavitalea sp.]